MKISSQNKIISSYNLHKKLVKATDVMKQDIKSGITYANRLSRQKKYGVLKSFQTKCIGINRKLPKDFWYAVVGTCTPVPGGTFLGIAVGRLIKNLKFKK